MKTFEEGTDAKTRATETQAFVVLRGLFYINANLSNILNEFSILFLKLFLSYINLTKFLYGLNTLFLPLILVSSSM